jgi:kynurenine formamidase
MAAYKGKAALEKGDVLDLSDIQACALEQGIQIQKHDILCLRLGFTRLFYERGKNAFYNEFHEPGLTYSPELVSWFHQMEIPALCTDTISNEASVDPKSGVALPLHAALMRNLGVALNEICNFEKLAEDCHADSQWNFLYAAAPLKIVDGTGAPVNPIAIK